MNKIFKISLLLGLGYYFTWYLFRMTGLPWNTSSNIPGFFLLAGSYPWSYVVFEYSFEMKKVFGQAGRDLLIVALVTVGFAVNVTVICYFFYVLKNIFKATSQRRRNT